MESRYFRAARVAVVLLGMTAAAWAQIGVFGGVQGGMNAARSGTGAPPSSLGANGDLYIDTTPGAQKLYGPKVGGAWPAGIPFTGSTPCGTASASALGCLIVPANSGLSVDASGHLSVTAGAFLGDPGTNGILMRTAAGTTGVANGSNLPSGYGYANLSGAPTDLGQFTNSQMGYLAAPTATASSSLLSVSNGTLMEDRSDPAMSTFNIGFHNWLTKITNVVLLGDSWTEGAGFTSFRNVWAEQLRTYLQSNSGSHGSGIVPLHTSSGAWALTGTWNTLNNLGPYQNGSNAFGMLYQASGTANTAAMTVKYYGDHLLVYYATYMDSGSGFTVTIDGTTTTTCGAATSASYTAATCSAAAAALGWHTAVIAPPATGNCYLYGAEWLVGTTGLSVHNLGRGAARSEAFGTNPATQMAWLKQIGGGVQLAVIALGVNDAGTSVPLATYQANLQAIITYLKTNFSPAPSILILDQGNASATYAGSYPQSAYTAIEQQLALANGAMFLSVSRRWGAYTNASALGVMYSDGLHPNDAGHLDIAQMVERRIVENTIPYVQTYPSLSQFMGNPTHNAGNETSSTGFGQGALGTGNFGSTGYNTGVGQNACYNLTTGHNNTCVGQYAGGTGPTTGLGNTLIGSNAQAGSATSYAVQLGGGTNGISNTAQYQAWNFLDSNGYGDFRVIKLSAGSVSTSGNSAVAVFGITHLTGTIPITILNPPPTSVGQSNGGQTGTFTGCVKLIADSGTTMTTGGNISAAYTLAAGKMYDACFDGTVWYLMGSGI